MRLANHIISKVPEIEVKLGEDAPFKSAIYPEAVIKEVSADALADYAMVFTKIGRRKWRPHVTFMNEPEELPILRGVISFAYMELDVPLVDKFNEYYEYLNVDKVAVISQSPLEKVVEPNVSGDEEIGKQEE